MTATPTPSEDLQRLAEELAAQLGRERGGDLLERARAMSVLNANRPGSQTTEFKMSALAIVAGLVMMTIGTFQEQAQAVDQGLELIQWSISAYAVSRGIAKLGASKPSAGPA